ncbi:MAG: hypothetical protein WBD74_08400 [Candidatus Aquilonibacter sp.]
MNGSSIELHESIAVAPAAARESLGRVLHALASANAGPTLDVSLRELHTPSAGSVEIPVAIGVQDHAAKLQYTLDLRATSKGLFPTFEGMLSLNPLGKSCELWLQGIYQPPFGIIGTLLDQTLLRGVAKRSLQRMLARISDDIFRDAREHYGLRNL